MRHLGSENALPWRRILDRYANSPILRWPIGKAGHRQLIGGHSAGSDQQLLPRCFGRRNAAATATVCLAQHASSGWAACDRSGAYLRGAEPTGTPYIPTPWMM